MVVSCGMESLRLRFEGGTAMAFIAAILTRRSLPSQALSACMA